MATLTQTLSSSCDVLFPEPSPGDTSLAQFVKAPLESSTVAQHTANSDAIYAAPSTSSYSTYSQEIRYIFDSSTGQAREVNNSFEFDQFSNRSSNSNSSRTITEDIPNTRGIQGDIPNRRSTISGGDILSIARDSPSRYRDSHFGKNTLNGDNLNTSGRSLNGDISNSNGRAVIEEIYTPPTPSAIRRKVQAPRTPPSGYKTPSGSALVVTGYVKDENHNHHEVKVVNINNKSVARQPQDLNRSLRDSPGARQPQTLNRSYREPLAGKQQDINRSYERSRSHDNRSADNVLSPRSHDLGKLSRGKVWYHRSLDHLASYDNNGYKYPSNAGSSHSNQSNNSYKSYNGSFGNQNNQSGSPHPAHKPPVAQRPLPGASQGQGQGQGHPGVKAATAANTQNNTGSLNRKLHWSLTASRRRTWSPPMFRKVLGIHQSGASLATMRHYHSNDELDAMEENYYEDLDAIRTPPRLAPISGQLGNKHVDKSVIKPIAFKPIITPQHRYVPAPARSMLSPRQPRSHDLTTTNHSTDDGYVSQDYNSGNHSHTTSNTSSSVSHNTSGQSHDPALRSHDHQASPDSSMIYSPPNRKHVALPEAPPATNQHPTHYGYIQTPSPSDSGVCDIEAMLRVKDAEIQTLRETMANNEAVIFQVYEEKRQNYAMEIKEVHDEWSRRFRDHQQKAFKTEQALLLQMFKLQQERKSLKLDCETAKTEKESLQHKFEDFEGEHEKLNNKMEELQWELVQKKGEISHLKSQLKQSNSEQTNRNNDLFGLKSQLKDAAKDTESKDADILRLRTELQMTSEDNVSLRREVEQLREQLREQVVVSRREVEPLREELTRMRLQNETLLAAKQRPSSSSPASLSTTTTTTTSPKLSPMATHAASSSLATNSAVSMVTPLASPSPGNLNRRCEIDEMRVEMAKLKTAMEQTCVQFENERSQWLDEKNKVIRYQKHLQLNYVQMYRKNKMLEQEVEQLMVELENRDLKLTPENGPIAGESTC